MNDELVDIAAIYNFEQPTDWLGTSGQPTAEQFQAIAEAGYAAVINLALPTSDNAIENEGSIVTRLGMRYFHIPVEMENPTLDDLKTFFGLMRTLDGKRVWVHCVVNARVSAFVYHYLRYEKGMADSAARTKLLARWEPHMDRVWRDFIAIPIEAVLT